MRITVAVCTHQPDEALLGTVLDAVEREVASAPGAEALLIDNASAPPLDTREPLRSRPVRIVAEPRPGLTAAREAAYVAARGDVIVFCDDDTLLGEGYLAAVAAAFERDERLGVLGGRILPAYESPPPAWALEFEPQLAVRRYPPGLYEVTDALPYTDRFPVGAGLAVRRELALRHAADCAASARIEGRRGGELTAGEDLDLALFALHSGHRIAVSGALALTHVIPPWRLEPAYLAQLAAGSVTSVARLEAKWAPRFGRPVFPVLARPLPALLARTAAAAVLARRSPSYAVKLARLRAQLRARRRPAP